MWTIRMIIEFEAERLESTECGNGWWEVRGECYKQKEKNDQSIPTLVNYLIHLPLLDVPFRDCSWYWIDSRTVEFSDIYRSILRHYSWPHPHWLAISPPLVNWIILRDVVIINIDIIKYYRGNPVEHVVYVRSRMTQTHTRTYIHQHIIQVCKLGVTHAVEQ